MLKPAKTRVVVDSRPPFARRRERIRKLPIRLALGVALFCCIALLLVPLARWAYHIEQGGRLLERAVRWPEPRLPDSFPIIRDEQQASAAIAHFQAASTLRQGNAFAWRQLAQLYGARQEWRAAAEALEQAARRQPSDPLIAWERSLVYEQQLEVLAQAPQEKILPDLLSVQPETPAQTIQTSYCEAAMPWTCYVAFDRFRLPIQGDSGELAVELESLFMYPPSAVVLKRLVYAGHPVLSFWLGLDPNMRAGKTDGAGFEVWITTPDGARQRVYTQSIDRATALSGWVPGQVDLSPWSGQEVSIELRTTGGLAGDTTDDWFAWGDITLTTPEAAGISRAYLNAKLDQSRQTAGLRFAELLKHGDQVSGIDSAAALRWYRRAQQLGAPLNKEFAFKLTAAELMTQQPMSYAADSDIVDLGAAQTSIPASKLRWLSSGETLTPSNNDPGTGVLWWSTPTAALINVAQPGMYELSTKVQDISKAGLDYELEHNLAPIAAVSLASADASWHQIKATVHLDAGMHLVGVRLANENGTDGIDRDGILGPIEIRNAAAAHMPQSVDRSS